MSRANHYTKETILQAGVKERKFPAFGIGDTITVSVKIKEGDKERLQAFQGDVIAIKNSGISKTFTVRKLGAGGLTVERIFCWHSPLIDSVTFVRKGRVRRAKLYYLRDRKGRAGRVKERIVTRERKQQEAEKATNVQR